MILDYSSTWNKLAKKVVGLSSLKMFKVKDASTGLFYPPPVIVS